VAIDQALLWLIVGYWDGSLGTVDESVGTGEYTGGAARGFEVMRLQRLLLSMTVMLVVT
jgi:hypothetical protein